MDRTESKTNTCRITLKALTQRRHIDYLSWVMGVLDQQKIPYISNSGSFNSEADLPFQATLGLDATQKQAIQLIWFFSDIALDPKNQAKSHFDPLTGLTAQRNATLEVAYHVDFKKGNRLLDNMKRLIPKKRGK